MKTSAITCPVASFDTATLFQTAARMELPEPPPVSSSAPAVTGQTFASLRQEVETASRPLTRPVNRTPISFDTVRLTVFIHTLERKIKTLEMYRPA